MTYDVIIVGAGPSGLACGIAAKEGGLSYLIVEQGGIADPTEMSFYSTPEMLTIGGLPFCTQSMRPSRTETLRYYRSVANFHELSLKLHSKVTKATKIDEKFCISTAQDENFYSRNLVLATGYFDTPTLLNIPGEQLEHVYHYYNEPYAYADCDVVVVGGGNSAVDASLELFRNGARVTFVHRRAKLGDNIKYWTKPDITNRIAEGKISAMFNHQVSKIDHHSVYLESTTNSDCTPIAAQAVFLLTGYSASLDLLSQLGAECNFERGEPIHDGNFETSIKGLFCAGSANCGIHTSEIYIENGRTHAKSIIPNLRT